MSRSAFANLDRMLQAVRSDGLDFNDVTARVVSDLFVARERHRKAEIEEFATLILPLIPKIETFTAVILAGRLAAHPDTPPALVEAIIRRDDEACDEMLARHPRLDPAFLAEVAAHGAPERALAVARRAMLDPALARALAERADPAVDHALAAAPHRDLPRAATARLTARARDDAALAAALIVHPSLLPAERLALFTHASPDQKAALMREADRLAMLARRPAPPAAAPDLDGLTPAEAARRRFGPATEAAERLLADPDGHGAVVVMRALGLSPEETTSRLILSGEPYALIPHRIFVLAEAAAGLKPAGALALIEAVADRSVTPAPEETRHRPGRPRSMAEARGREARGGAAATARRRSSSE
jgi:uncharacterized protein (DUF2336 family)